MATTNSTSVSLKLLIDTKSHKVLFPEASKEVVDFLFSFLSLHVATVTRLVSTDGMVGCLGNLYQSVESLSVNKHRIKYTSIQHPQFPNLFTICYQPKMIKMPKIQNKFEPEKQ
ncbi:hypothetical protein ACE6H2_008215 [Prunus campanulata]